MKYLMLFADGFEDIEALATMDVLSRGNEEVICCSMMKRLNVLTRSNKYLTVDKLIEDVSLDEFDALIIPGGPASFKVLAFMDSVDKIIKYFVEHEKLVCAICAAPFLVGRLGYLKNLNYTVHPGFEDKIIGGTYKRNLGVVESGNFITAKSMYYSIDFGLAIYKHFHGEEKMNELKNACMGESK